MLTARTFGAAFVAVCGLMLTTRSAQCSEVRINASADAYIMNIPECTQFNFGDDPVLVCYNDGNSNKMHSLLRFDLNEIKIQPIRSARLRLWSTDWEGDFSNSSRTTIYALTMPWIEQEVSWAAPTNKSSWQQYGGGIFSNGATGPTFAVNSQGMSIPSGKTSMMEWDITQLVRMWVSKKLPNNGLYITDDDGVFVFESRESPHTNLRPTLIVELGK